MSADDDWRAQPGYLAAFGSIAGDFKPHPAVNDLRIGKYLVDIVDGACRYTDGLELGEEVVALHFRRKLGEPSDQFLPVREAADIVPIFGLFGQFRFPQNAAQFGVLVVIAGG